MQRLDFATHVSTNTADSALPDEGFVWLDFLHDEVAADPEAWRQELAKRTGTLLFELHVKDILNALHPSRFEATHAYELLIFRKLALHSAPSEFLPHDATGLELHTQPVSFLLLDRALITVRAAQSRTIESLRHRFLEYQENAHGAQHGARLPHSPEELLLRLINAMVDQFLDLRQPLNRQMEYWQRALLDPNEPFEQWVHLLDARAELRKLDHLCEEQHDALQELRDHLLDSRDHTHENDRRDLLLVRVNDVLEHITRVLHHAQRLEASLESTVQIHFSAMAHRTSEIMRTLTVITALFMPLTLITGIFGMNFPDMPLLHHPEGFWLTMLAMLAIVVLLLLTFRAKRYLDSRRASFDFRR